MREEHFDTPGDVAVRVDNRAGRVSFTTHPAATTDVEITALEAGAEEAAAAATIVHEVDGGTHRVVVRVPGHGRGGLLRSLIGSASAVGVTVRVPEGASVDTSTASASVRAAGRYGAVTAESASGSIDVESVTGPVRAKSASGDVTVASVAGDASVTTASGSVRCGVVGGASTVATASGDVAVDDAGGDLRVTSASGDVRAGTVRAGGRISTTSGDTRLGAAVAGPLRVETVTGDVTVGVATGTAVRVDAQTVSGDLSSEIDLDHEPGEAGGGPSLEIVARSVSGDIAVVRAATTPA